jgi:hypothetical protein
VQVFFYAERQKKRMRDKEYWLKWVEAAGIRAIKTACQTSIAMIGTSLVLADVNWELVLSAAALAGVLSLLTSLAGLPELGDE